MAKFIIGVLVGLFLGASTTTYGASASQTGTLSGWTVTRNDEEVCSGPRATEASGPATDLIRVQISRDKPRSQDGHPCR